MRYKLLVFDWDGTLTDSSARITESVLMAITTVGAEPRTRGEIRNIIGLGLTEAIRALYSHADDAFCEAMALAYRESFADNALPESQLFNGTKAVLTELARSDYLLAIATGKSTSGLTADLKAMGLTAMFQAFRCADQSQSKPHPAMLCELMDELNCHPSETLMIGDTEYDMEMANRAGVAAMAVSYGVHDSARLVCHSPLAILDDICSLPAMLARCHTGMTA